MKTITKQLMLMLALLLGTATYAQVGIGTQTPSATLDIVSDGTGAGTKALEISNGATPTALELFTILDNGNVGIGTPTPEYKLDITGDGVNGVLMELRFKSDDDEFLRIDKGLGDQFRIISAGPSAGPFKDFVLQAGTYSNQVVLDPNNGNVGIGSDNPNARLDITGIATTVEKELMELRFSNTDPNYLQIDAGQTGTYFRIISAGVPMGAHRPLVLQAGSFSNQFFLEPSGDIGIATNDPDARLDVNGNVRIGTVVTGAAGDDILTRDVTTGIVNIRSASEIAAAGITADNGLTKTVSNIQLGGDLIKATTIDLDSYALNLTSTGDGDFNVDSNTLVVDASENSVGIGTAAPAYPLDVISSTTPAMRVGNGTSQGALYLGNDSHGVSRAVGGITGFGNPNDVVLYTSGTGATTGGAGLKTENGILKMLANGKVGIGEAVPTQPLEVVGNILSSGTAPGVYVFSTNLGMKSRSSTLVLQGDNTGGIEFDVTSGDAAMKLVANGNVGIGMGAAAPSEKLEVNGNTLSDNVYVFSDSYGMGTITSGLNLFGLNNNGINFQTLGVTDNPNPGDTGAVDRMRILKGGGVRIYNLAGTGNRYVTANTAGILGTTAIPDPLTGSTSIVITAAQQIQRAALTAASDIIAAQNSNNLQIRASSVCTTEIANNSITADDIGINAVGNSELGPDAVQTGNIALNTITAADIAPNAVGNSELGLNAVESGNIALNTITAADIAADAVGASELANDAVGSANIILNSITAADIATDAVGALELGPDSVGNSELNTGGTGTAGQVLTRTGTGSQIAWANNTAVPSGAIMMWNGATAPTGWVICDGNNGTPNLRDRFIVGAGPTYAVGATGGANTVTLTTAQMPSHNHTATTGTGGAHRHRMFATGISNSRITEFPDEYVAYNADFSNNANYTMASHPDNAVNGFNGEAGTHAHTVNVGSTGSGNAHENRPPYYALAFIMKQ